MQEQDWPEPAHSGFDTPPAAPTGDVFSPAPFAAPSPTPAGAPTPVAAPLAVADAAEAATFTPAAAALVERHGGPAASSADGLDYLMRSCTHMLKSRMGVAASPPPAPPAAAGAGPEVAMDAVGPVLETVLSNLTEEYERRLVAKDQERKAQAAVMDTLKRQVEALEAETGRWRVAVESAGAAAAAEAAAADGAAAAAATAEAARLRAEQIKLSEKLAIAEKELSAKQQELKNARDAAASAAATADAELAALRAELDRYAGLEDRLKAIKDENRELYNTVQDLRGAIRVFARVRPAGATGDASESVVEVGEEGALAVYSAKHSKWQQFQFDRVFGEASTQQDVWGETKPLVRSVLDGFNVCVFAYGQTGSGKTFTMMGGNGASDGLSFRALEDIFEQRDERAEETAYTVRVQLVEIYNEVIRDLLNPSSAPLELKATRSSGHNLQGATQVEVTSPAEVAALMERGGRARATAETAMNERSSRSHQVLTVMVEGCAAGSRATTRGCLHLIDLAGSERVSRSGATGQQLTEAQHINRSLTALGSVMAALAERRDHVPFRDSKLTQLLADSLSGNAKAMMFVHISPEASSAPETLSTLHFGRGVTEITLGAAKRNVESGSVWEAREAREKLAAARVEAAEERAARQALEAEVSALRARVAALETGSTGSAGKIAAHRPDSGLKRPPQVGRLNLSKLGSPGAAGTPERGSSGSLSARAASSKIPTPVLSRSGSLTSRPSLGRPGVAESKLPRTGSSRLSIGSGSGSFSFGTDAAAPTARTARAPVAPAGHARRWM